MSDQSYEVGSGTETSDIQWTSPSAWLNDTGKKGDYDWTSPRHAKFHPAKNLTTLGLFFSHNDGLHNLVSGHKYKYKDRSQLNIRKFFFSQRVVDSRLVGTHCQHMLLKQRLSTVSNVDWAIVRVGAFKAIAFLQPDIIKVRRSKKKVIRSWR